MKKKSMEEMGRLSEEEFKDAPWMDVTVVLDNVRSMMNTGSIFRTADAFRARRICLCGFTATPPHREIHKTALGATESVPWEYHHSCAELIRKLKSESAVVVAVEQIHGSISPFDWQPDGARPLVLVFGNEVTGVDDKVLEMCDYGLEIPQYGTKHSFNIAVSAGIILWEAYRHLGYRLL
jgi:23S rRNA (guanosine2251-2'-O)-methyltransferase